jgi:hypothetical protein
VLESETNAKLTTSQFEEIASITEIEESSKQDKEDPVKFDITTKNNNCFKIITNSFMTTECGTWLELLRQFHILNK